MKAIVCDLDGSLMKSSGGPYIGENVRKKIIELQEKGVLVILNSARIFQGIYSVSKQLNMKEYGGYIIASNGCQVFDTKLEKNIFGYKISREVALTVWDICKKYGVSTGICCPDYVVSNYETEGYFLDNKNCNIDYIYTDNPENFIKEPIFKCTMSEIKEYLDIIFDGFSREIKNKCGLRVIRSTPTYIDIIVDGVDKFTTNDWLLKEIGIEWKDVSAIGDGLPDLQVVAHAGLGVTLENGNPKCKAVADIIVPGCDDDGCLVWLNQLLNDYTS